MRTRTDTILFRLGFTLAVLVLSAFVALIGATVLACVAFLGAPRLDRRHRARPRRGPGPARPLRRAHRPPRRLALRSAQARPAATSRWYFSVMWATAWFCSSAMPGRVSVARALASRVDWAWPWNSGITCWAISS